MSDSPRLAPLAYSKTTLTNGLDVIVRRQGELPIVGVNLWYHVGSKDEERGRRGYAHLFEHLMFEGSEHYPGDYFKPLQRIGASVNGSTSTDRTNYFEDVPSAHLELAVAMESDRMGGLLPALTDEKLRVQKDVVKNEYRQNYANRPYGQVWRLLAEALYPPDHSYSWLTIGAMEDVEAASHDDVSAFFQRYYVPSNASLAIVGDVEEDPAFALAERYFGALPGGTKALRPKVPALALDASIEIQCHDRVELDRIYLNWPSVAQFQPEDATLTLMADVLARGKSSRLFRRLVMEEELAQDVSAFQSGRELAGSFAVVVTLRPGRDPNRARALVDEELARIVVHGVEPDELRRVLNGRQAGFLYALDNVGGFGGVADRLNAYNIYLGDPGRITSDLERYQAVTIPDLIAATSSHLANRPRVALTVLGRKPKAMLPPLDRAARPAPAPAVAFWAPTPIERRLRCGSMLWVIPRRDLPIVSATAVVSAGASAHEVGRGGLAELTSDMMDEGTATRSALDLAGAAEMLGTHLGTSCGWDGSYVSLQCLTPHLDASLDLACDVLLNPSFPESEWSRVWGRARASLVSAKDSAEDRAWRALIAALYPSGHPYRLPVEGDEATVGALGLDDLRGFHRAWYRPDRAAWVVAGDVDADEMADRLDGLLGGWSGSAEARCDVDRVESNGPPRIILVDRPGAPQAVVRVGQVGTHRHDSNYDDLIVFNQVLGGQFTSRLNTRLREEKGYTYGIRSGFDARRGAGPFSISSSLQADRLADALRDLRAEVVALLDDRPPTAEELADARRALIEGQARHFETPSALVSRYAGLIVHGLPMDDHARLSERLGRVTVDSAVSVARRLLRPEAMTTVVVADAEEARPALEGLGWGEVVVIEAGGGFEI